MISPMRRKKRGNIIIDICLYVCALCFVLHVHHQQDGGFGGRDGYRGGEGKASAPGDFNPEYRGSGFGRGASMQR